LGAPDRIVRHLRLRADSEASVRRTARKLEDALRCASLPDAGARLLLVRRLELGRIAAGASSQTLSLLLEQRVVAAGASWIHGAAPEAERSELVYFRDALEARCELALRLAKGAACTAWYWPLAAPEFVPVESAPGNLRRIALAIASLPEAPAALPAWVARLAAAGAAQALARAVGEAEGAELLRVAGVPLYTKALQASPGGQGLWVPRGAEGPEARSRPQRAGSERAILPAWIRALAAAGGFAPLSATACGPLRRAPEAPAPKPVSGVRPVSGEQSIPTSSVTLASAAGFAGAVAEPDAPHEARRRARADARPEPGLAKAGGQRSRASEIEETALAPEPCDPSSPHLFAEAPRSAYAGLVFLVPVLQRLGFAAWAETLPSNQGSQVATRLFALVLRRLSASPDDPAWLIAAHAPRRQRVSVRDWPASWNDPLLAAPRGCADRELAALGRKARSVKSLSEVWLVACRRWLRRAARIGVANLVVRPANLSVIATHIDVFFRLEDAAMRVRRAGLDIDPGWVPWLRRVVTFHYVAKPSLAASGRSPDLNTDGY
jgi:hypothetical protein